MLDLNKQTFFLLDALLNKELLQHSKRTQMTWIHNMRAHATLFLFLTQVNVLRGALGISLHLKYFKYFNTIKSVGEHKRNIKNFILIHFYF